MTDRMLVINKSRERNLIRYLEKAKRECIDYYKWAVPWHNKFPNYITYQRTIDDEHRTHLTVRIGSDNYFLTTDKDKSNISTKKCWGTKEPLMKDVLRAYKIQWGILVKKAQSEEEDEEFVELSLRWMARKARRNNLEAG
ncbi:hypothetical protein ACKAV7_009501 [Fusarium commune]